VTTLEHPPHSPDLTQADFYLFHGLKTALKGRRLCDATDVIKNEMEELKELLQNGFKEFIQHLYSRRQKCIVAQRHILKLPRMI
jgi:hypothetical protein